MIVKRGLLAVIHHVREHIMTRMVSSEVMVDRRQVIEIRVAPIRAEIVVQRIQVQHVTSKQVMLRSTTIILRTTSLHVRHLNVAGHPSNAIIAQIVCDIVQVRVVQIIRVVAAQVVIQVDQIVGRRPVHLLLLVSTVEIPHHRLIVEHRMNANWRQGRLRCIPEIGR